MSKGLFIGIGDAGVATVTKLKDLLLERAYGSSIADMKAECAFVLDEEAIPELEHYADREIWVFSTSHEINGLLRKFTVDPNMHIRLVLFMPKAFIDQHFNKAVVADIATKSCSTFEELEKFPNLYVMPVDVESQDGKRIHLRQLYANTAELCYFLHVGAVAQWSNPFVASGYKAVVKADGFLKDYVKARYRYDACQALLGRGFEKILPTPEQQQRAISAFKHDDRPVLEKVERCIAEHGMYYTDVLLERVDFESGFLRQIRKGNENSRGLKMLAHLILDRGEYYLAQCRNLGVSFFETQYDLSTEYCPRVSDFVNGDSKFGSDHLFERLYSSIDPLGFLKKAPLSFVGFLMSRTDDDVVLKTIEKRIDDYIEYVFQSDDFEVKRWLDLPLESVFEEKSVAVPVFYPIVNADLPEVNTRMCKISDPLAHRFVVIKLVEGYSFRNYKYYDLLNTKKQSV